MKFSRSHQLFIDGTLAELLIDFTGRVTERVENLPSAHAVTGPVAAQAARAKSDELLDGLCSDLAWEVQQSRDKAAAEYRNLTADTLADFTYLMAAYVDEYLIFKLRDRLTAGFRGAVEQQLFGTGNAGEQIFLKIQRLTSRRGSRDADLAAAYLLILSLGFKGQFIVEDSSGVLKNYYRELSRMALTGAADHSPPARMLRASQSAIPARMGFRRQHSVILWACAVLVWALAITYLDAVWRQASAPVRKSLSPVQTSRVDLSLRADKATR
jgi:type IV/VI secretion system ImpK/VasF family protein